MASNSKPMKIDQKTLKDFVHYDPSTGIFRWAKDIWGARQIGVICGTTRDDGRVTIGINGQLYGANRLAWLYMTGEDPVGFEIVPKDRNFSNARFANLEKHESSPNDGLAWKKRNETNSDYYKPRSGHQGITMTKYGKYMVRGTVDGALRAFGTRNSLKEALELRNAFYTALGKEIPD